MSPLTSDDVSAGGSRREPPLAGPDTSRPPLVVDLDGTLLRTDLLWEGLVRLFFFRPLRLVGFVRALAHGRAAAKAFLGDEVRFDLARLPCRPAVARLLAETTNASGEVVLASGADRRLVEGVAARFGIAETHASNGVTNLTSDRKLAALLECHARFDYVGNARADFPLWRHARRAYAVGLDTVDRGLARRVRPDLELLDDPAPPGATLLSWAVRPEVVGNLLVALPVMAAGGSLSGGQLATLVVGGAALTAAGIGARISGALRDLDRDRADPGHRPTPIADGWIPLATATPTAMACLLGAAFTVPILGAAFGWSTAAYTVLTFGRVQRWLEPRRLAVLVAALAGVLRATLGFVLIGIPLRTEWIVAAGGVAALGEAAARTARGLAGRSGAAGDPTARATLSPASDAPRGAPGTSGRHRIADSSSAGRHRLKRLLLGCVPLAARQMLAVWIGRRRQLTNRYWWVLELLRDYADRNPNDFHRFLWSHHLAYAESYEVQKRFGAERVHPSRRMLLDDLQAWLDGQGIVPACDVRSVLEMGCSLGYLLRHLETGMFRMAEVLEGIDIDAYAIRVGSEYLARQGSRVRLTVADVASLDEMAAGRRYDVTLCAGVLMYLTQDEAGRVVEALLRHTGRVAAFAGLAHPDQDNAELPRSELRQRDGTFIHNLDAMVDQAGGEVIFRRWEGPRMVNGNTIYFVFAAPATARQ